MLFDDYLAIKKELFDYFGFPGCKFAMEVEDYRKHYWYMDSTIGYDTEVHLLGQTDNQADKCTIEGSIEVFTTRELPKWEFVGEFLTLIALDDRMSGKHLGVFRNAIRRHEPLPER